MGKILENEIECVGCGACANACPAHCITMQEDERGFLNPVIDDTRCVDCNRCKSVCPVNHIVEKIDNFEKPEVWAAWSMDETIRYMSTSGGVFSELAIQVLQSDGMVCGALYNDQHMVEHCCIYSVEGIAKLRQSKYVQSDMGNVYQTIKNELQNGRLVLFCGTPCECAAVDNYLGMVYDNLILVDFVCRGSNSPKVYRMFLDSLERKYGAKVDRVWFKNKVLGWRKFSTRIEFENGEVYSEDRYSDTYIRGYIKANLFMRESCATCKYKNQKRITDISLGDFWGIKSVDVGADTDGGTSLVMLNSSKGQELYESVMPRLYAVKRSYEEACQGNKCILSAPVFNSKRNDFWEDIDRIDIIENINRFISEE